MSSKDGEGTEIGNKGRGPNPKRGAAESSAGERVMLAEAFRKAEREKSTGAAEGETNEQSALTSRDKGPLPGVGTVVRAPTIKRDFPADAAFGTPWRGSPVQSSTGETAGAGPDRAPASTLQNPFPALSPSPGKVGGSATPQSKGAAAGYERLLDRVQEKIQAEVMGKARRQVAAVTGTPGAAASEPAVDRISSMREPRLMSFEDLEQKRIIHPAHPNRQAVERFRDLRTRILQISKGRNFALMVSSAVNNGGASFVAINLAAAFSFDSSKTALLIDCNLRYPSLHHAFDMIPELGVTDYLDDPRMDIASIIYPTGVRRLRFVPAGKRKEATADYFTSQRMKQFLTSVRERYPDRFIILDTPPINESPDASILAELADYVMVVVPHGKVRQARVVEACARVARDKLLGVVLNH